MNTRRYLLSLLSLALSLMAQSRDWVVGLVDVCNGSSCAVGLTCIQAVQHAGYVPVVIPLVKTQAEAHALVRRIDALLLVGGEDVNPERYGASPSPHLGRVNECRDTLEYLLLGEAVRQHRPIMGICRGAQMINVFFGGSLYQDLPSEFPVQQIRHNRPDNIMGPVHGIHVDPSSLLHRALGTDSIGVNSTHHQAVKDLAPGFTISARATDGVVEAIENNKLHVHAIQFHPELLISDERYANIFRRFLRPGK